MKGEGSILSSSTLQWILLISSWNTQLFPVASFGTAFEKKCPLCSISTHYKKHVPSCSSFASEKSQMLPRFLLRLAGHPVGADHTSSLHHPPQLWQCFPVRLSQHHPRQKPVENAAAMTPSPCGVDTTLLEGAATRAVTPRPHLQQLCTCRTTVMAQLHQLWRG